MLLGREGAQCGNTSLIGEARAYLSRTGLRQWGEWEWVQNSSENHKKKLAATDLFFLISSNTSSFFYHGFIFNLQTRR